MPVFAIVDNSRLFPDLKPSETNSREGEPFFNGSSVILSAFSDAGLGFEYPLPGALGDSVRLSGTQSHDSIVEVLVKVDERESGGTWTKSNDSSGLIDSNSPLPYPKANKFVAGIGPWFDSDDGVEQTSIKVSSKRGALELDYLLYTPSAKLSAAGASLVLDDQEEQFNYSGDWNHTTGVAFPTGSAMNDTISQTRTAGSSFKVTYVGSGFELYGAIQQVPGNVTVSYNLDSGQFRDTVVLNHAGVTYQGLPANQTHWTLNRRLFHQPNLSGFEDREHTLEVTVDSITGDQVLSIDYLVFTGTRWTNVTSVGSPLATPFPIVEGGSKSNKLAIGLGVSLPLAALLIAVAVFMFIRSKKAKK